MRKLLALLVLIVIPFAGLGMIVPENAAKSNPTRQTPTPVPTLPAVPGSFQPSGNIPGPWHLVFDDEFDGNSLDLSKWQPNWLAGNDTSITKPVNSLELSCYDPKHVTLTGNGVLNLHAEKEPCLANNGTTYQYASGLVNSSKDFLFAYGYMEARMYLPDDGNGNILNWPAFWTDGTGRWPTTGEIDVMEGLDGSPSWHYHYGHGGGSSNGGYPKITPKTGWHTFAADWEPGKITFYYDGIDGGSTDVGVVGNVMYLILNYGISNTIAPPASAPADLQVDYVRVWQH